MGSNSNATVFIECASSADARKIRDDERFYATASCGNIAGFRVKIPESMIRLMMVLNKEYNITEIKIPIDYE